MRRIATPTRQLNKFGPGRDGFTDGDPIAGIPSTDLEADWFDALQEEAAAIAEYGGVALDPNDNTQLLQGIQRLIAVALTSRPLICSILDLPTTNVGPIIVTECSEVWTWANTAFFTGYRSLLCGRPLMATPPRRWPARSTRSGACYRRSESTRACGAMRRSKAWFVRKLCGKPIAARIGSRTTRPRSSACPTCATCSAASRDRPRHCKCESPGKPTGRSVRSHTHNIRYSNNATPSGANQAVLDGVAPPA